MCVCVCTPPAINDVLTKDFCPERVSNVNEETQERYGKNFSLFSPEINCVLRAEVRILMQSTKKKKKTLSPPPM